MGTRRKHDNQTTPKTVAFVNTLTLAALTTCASAFSATGASRFTPSRPSMISMQDLMTPDKLKEAFARFDSDRSGQVDLQEFMDKMKTLDMPFTNVELEQMFETMDRSGNGGIDATEFEAYVLNNAYVGVVRRLAATPSKIRDVYESFKGTAHVLEFEAFEAGMRSLGLPYNRMELESMFAEIDESSNGVVDFAEFEAFMSQKVLPQWATLMTEK